MSKYTEDTKAIAVAIVFVALVIGASAVGIARAAWDAPIPCSTPCSATP